MAKIPLAADLKSLDEMMSAHIQIFNRSIVSIEALDPLEEVIDDIYKAHRLVLDAYDEYFKTGAVSNAERTKELYELSVIIKKHQIVLNDTLW